MSSPPFDHCTEADNLVKQVSAIADFSMRVAYLKHRLLELGLSLPAC